MKKTVFYRMKGVILIGVLIGIIFIVSVAVFMIPKTEKFDTLSKGYYSGCKNESKYVINNERKFGEVWSKIFSIQTSIPNLPKIDFTKYTVIAVCLGEKSTGGYGITIENIKDYKDNFVVKINRTYPLPDMILTQAFSQPYYIVKVKKINKPIMFEE